MQPDCPQLSCGSLTPEASGQCYLACKSCISCACGDNAAAQPPCSRLLQAQTTLSRLLTSGQHAGWQLLSAGGQSWSQLAQAGTLMLLTSNLLHDLLCLIMKSVQQKAMSDHSSSYCLNLLLRHSMTGTETDTPARQMHSKPIKPSFPPGSQD